MNDSFKIDSIESLYKGLNDRDEIKIKAYLILMVRDWLTAASTFDPVSGDVIQTSIDDFSESIVHSFWNVPSEREIKDRIYRIVSHTKEAVLAIMEHTRDKILREHAMLPIHAAREVDSSSIQWLSRQPGRTLREKLSGKPYMKAVRRRTSVDTSENRLLRAFLCRLEQILIERQNILSTENEETCEELLVYLQRWLRIEEVAEIGVWGNLPPNNTLLQDKHYRKIWDGWLWLQAIDEQIIEDSERVHKDILTVIYWNTVSLLKASRRLRIVQQPVGLDYDDFSIVPKLPVQGYLFPAPESKIKGKIKFIKPDKLFGFITSEDGLDLFFHQSNLSRKLDINTLTAGDEVYFVIGSNRHGECADNITIPAGIILIDFNLTDDKWNIQVGEEKSLIEIVSGNLVIEQAQGEKKKLKIEPATLKDLSKTILSLIIDVSFECDEPTYNQTDLIRMDSSVVDLCSIRPTFTNNAGSQANLPFKLLQQIWTHEDGTKQTVDCGSAMAIALRSDIETVSMWSLFSHSSTMADTTKSRASMFFVKKLSDYIKADKLTYLVPDWGNDFDLEGIRKSVNFYFDESTPLPRSIAAIFAWQSSKKFIQDKVQEKDFILVMDSFDGGISITPVQAKYNKELAEILPDTQGISWERHPTVMVPNKSIQTSIGLNLDVNGCQTSEELLHLFGFDGLTKDSGQVSFVKDDHWYHLSSSIRESLTQDLDLNILSNDTIRDCLNATSRDCQGVGIFVLPLEDTIRKKNVRMDCNWLGSAWSPIKGSQILNRWQNEVEDIALWRDHLPELSIRIVRDGLFENFYLVKNATVTPQRGRTVNIPVEELFTLPAGQIHYRFPLQQGEGHKELQFVAYLKSSAFPLKKDMVCKLKMTYTYGADDPYELKFIPLDSAEVGLKSIRVEWRSALDDDAADLENLPVPDFPIHHIWSDFQNFPKEDGKSFSNLLDWVKRDLEKICDISSNGRVSGIIPKWINKENDNVFCFIDDVFVHKTSLRLRKDQALPQQGEVLSFYKIKDSKGKLLAEDVTIGTDKPKGCFLSKSLRFPVLTIWNHGHSLSETDAPDHFRKSILEAIKNVLSIIESENMPDSLKEELFFFLCCLHKDAPDIVGSRLLIAVKDKILLRSYSRNIAFAIGNAELPWQQELLANVINPIDNEGLTRSIAMEILSIALWRSRTLIKKFTKIELEALSRNIYGCLEFDIQKVESEGKKYQIATLSNHLELLLALLRSRELEDKDSKMIFAPNNDLTKQYVNLIDNLSKLLINSGMNLKSRISLQIEKPESLCKVPDLLYVLRMYLTGDSGANSISITAVSDD
ncbi:DUF2357 domain-containing protein [Acinetobacter bereziniae]|uniref:DUF2357 domain-containing protein n=1 Tax=Acinetobacter bereziniae TaxID=106648 RepID=UPI0025779A10|nr:DUF2357 domain-containing protein [Acinetobacter bereziniae]MDM1782880.1 DUF2357 domain-containing protein [Acinetobacter bereziniae]